MSMAASVLNVETALISSMTLEKLALCTAARCWFLRMRVYEDGTGLGIRDVQVISVVREMH